MTSSQKEPYPDEETAMRLASEQDRAPTSKPWEASEANFGQWSVGPADNVIAATYSLGSNGRRSNAEANAKLIVKAVNNHAALIEALEAIAEFCSGDLTTLGSIARLGSIQAEARRILGAVGTPSTTQDRGGDQ